MRICNWLQASKRCCTPKEPPKVIPSFQPQHKLAKTRRKFDDAPCRSRDDAYYKTALYATTLTEEQAKANAGHRTMPLFAADQKTSNKGGAADCTKNQYSTGALAPGLMVCYFSWNCFFACVQQGQLKATVQFDNNRRCCTMALVVLHLRRSNLECFTRRANACRSCGACSANVR